MRVLIVNSLFPPIGHGGAERSVAELAEGLAADGFAVAVVTLAPSDSPTALPRSETTASGVRVHRWQPPGSWPFGARRTAGPLGKIVWHLRESYRPSARALLRAVLRDFSPDVVHTNNIAGFGVAILHDIRRHTWVHTLRDYYLLCPRTTRFRRGARCGGPCLDCRSFALVRRLPIKPPDEVVGVSDSILEAHRSAGVWTRSTSSVVPNQPAVGVIAHRRVEAVRTVGFIGRVPAPKGALVLLRAFADPTLATFHLLLAGPADEAARVALSRWSSVDRVRHAGVLEAEQFFSQVDLVVVPSQWEEPYGRVAAEAVAVGLPVVVSRRGGLPEAVDAAEMSLIVDEPSDPVAWASAIRDAATRWHSFDVGGMRTIRRRPVHEVYAEVYERALARSHRSERTRRAVGRR